MNQEELLRSSQEALDKEREKEKAKERKRRAAAAGVAVVASASLVVGGLFNSPSALLEDQDLLPAVVYNDNDSDDLDSSGDDGVSDEDEGSGVDEEEAVSGVRAGLRQRILQLPYAVRLLVILPLWALGFGILSAATALWSAVLSPVLAKALGWLCLLGALVGAFLLAGKSIFPDLPIRKILNKRSLIGLILGAVLLGTADLVAPLVWVDYVRIEAIVRICGVGLVLAGTTIAFVRREHKRRKALPPVEAEAAEEPEETEPKPLTREDILAIADSVSPRARHSA